MMGTQEEVCDLGQYYLDQCSPYSSQQVSAETVQVYF